MQALERHVLGWRQPVMLAAQRENPGDRTARQVWNHQRFHRGPQLLQLRVEGPVWRLLHRRQRIHWAVSGQFPNLCTSITQVYTNAVEKECLPTPKVL